MMSQILVISILTIVYILSIVAIYFIHPAVNKRDREQVKAAGNDSVREEEDSAGLH